MPGCTIGQRWRDQTSFGMAIFSIGAMIRSGTSRETAAIIAASVAATQTRISWPRSPSSIHRRWLRLLWADVEKSILTSSLPGVSPAGVKPEPVFPWLRPGTRRKERRFDRTLFAAPAASSVLEFVEQGIKVPGSRAD